MEFGLGKRQTGNILKSNTLLFFSLLNQSDSFAWDFSELSVCGQSKARHLHTDDYSVYEVRVQASDKQG